MSGADKIITELYGRMYNFMLDYAERRLENRALAEEAVQETFKIAWIKQDDLCSSIRPKGWLMNTLKNVISNMRRNQETASRVMGEYLAANCRDMAITEDGIRFEILYGDAAESEELKLIKELADGASYYEMAERRGITVPTCRKRVQRAREVLQKKFLK